MDERDDTVEDLAEQVRRFKDVFRATWQEAVGRHWPDLEGDVEALCAQAFALGVAHGRRRPPEAASLRLVAERRSPFDERK